MGKTKTPAHEGRGLLEAARRLDPLEGEDLTGLYAVAVAFILAMVWYSMLSVDSWVCRPSPEGWASWWECRLPWEW